MIKFTTNYDNKEHRREFDSYDEFLDYIALFGSLSFTGESTQFLIRENDLTKLRECSTRDENIIVVTKANNISVLNNFIEDKFFNPSKYDLIQETLQLEGVEVENKKTVLLLMKTLHDSDIRNQILDIASKCENYITNDYIQKSYFVDDTKHPVNVLVSVLKGRGYKSVLAKCRRVYSDSAIRKTMLDYLRKSIKILSTSNLGYNVKHNKISIFGTDKVCNLFVTLNKFKNLEEALIQYERRD